MTSASLNKTFPSFLLLKNAVSNGTEDSKHHCLSAHLPFCPLPPRCNRRRRTLSRAIDWWPCVSRVAPCVCVGAGGVQSPDVTTSPTMFDVPPKRRRMCWYWRMWNRWHILFWGVLCLQNVQTLTNVTSKCVGKVGYCFFLKNFIALKWLIS